MPVLNVPDMEQLREAAQCGRLTESQLIEAADQALEQARAIVLDIPTWAGDLAEFAAAMLRERARMRSEAREARAELLKGVGS